jgi:hypothetical protein
MSLKNACTSVPAVRRDRVTTPALLAVAGLCLSATNALASPPSYGLQRVGLVGPTYVTSGNYSGLLTGISSTGTAWGSTNRFVSNVANGRDTWFFNGASTVQIGLTGGTYTQGNGFEQGTVTGANDSSLLGGFSTRYLSGSSTSIGQDAWVYDGLASTQVQVGFTSGIYVSNSTSNFTRSSNVAAVAANNLVLGTSNRYSPTQTTGTTATQIGADAWVYNPATNTTTLINPGNAGTPTPPVGTTGATGVTYSKPSDLTRNISVLGANSNATGQVVGTTSRYSSASGTLGTDVWLYDGSATTVLGMSNANNFNQVAGTSLGSRTSAIPVTNAINASGQVIGTTLRYNTAASTFAAATDAWLYSPGGGGTYTVVGLTGGVYSPVISGTLAGTQVSTPVKLNSFGRVAGTSNRYATASSTQIGQDAFVYNGTSSVQVSPSGTMYTASDNTASASITALSNSAAPFAVGQIARYNGGASSPGIGSDVWIYNTAITSPTSTIIGLSGAGPSAGSIAVNYTKADGTQNNTFRNYNDAGFVVGSSVRYDANGFSIGNAGWIYDVNAQSMTTLLFPTNFGNDTVAGHVGGLDLATTTPSIVTALGNVLGTYTAYDALGATLGTRAFVWSTSDGYSDLGGLINGGLSAAGWDRLSTISLQSGPLDGSGYPKYLAGTGRMIGETADGSLYIVPTPGTGGLLAFGLMAAAKRRRR